MLRTRRDGRDRSISARRGVSVAVTGPIKRFEALAGVLSRFHAAPGAWRARARMHGRWMTSAKSAQTWREVCQQKLQIRRLTTRILNSKTTVCASRRRKTPRKRRTDGGRESTKVFCMIRFTQPKIHPDSCLTAISSAGCNFLFPLRFSYGSSLDDFRHDARCTSGAVWKNLRLRQLPRRAHRETSPCSCHQNRSRLPPRDAPGRGPGRPIAPCRPNWTS